MTTILGRKLEMSQVFMPNGDCVPVTIVQAGPCVVTQRKTLAVDQYESVQLGLDPDRNPNKAMTGHFKKHNVEPRKVLREVRVTPDEKLAVGDEVKVDIFAAGDIVDVTGLTKGRGFAGGMKRWGWHGGKASHGSMSHRRIGSVGSNTYPGRPWRGRTLPGRYGCEQVTMQNLTVVKVEPEKHLLYLHGAVPGVDKALLVVTRVRGPKVKKVPEKPAKASKK